LIHRHTESCRLEITMRIKKDCRKNLNDDEYWMGITKNNKPSLLGYLNYRKTKVEILEKERELSRYRQDFECIKHHYNDKTGYNANIIKQIKHIEDNFEVRPYRDIIEPVLFYMSSRTCTGNCTVLRKRTCTGNCTVLRKASNYIHRSPEAFKDQETSSFSANNDQSSPNDQYDDGEDVDNSAIEPNDLESERKYATRLMNIETLSRNQNNLYIRYGIILLRISGQHTPTNNLFDMNALNESIRDKDPNIGIMTTSNDYENDLKMFKATKPETFRDDAYRNKNSDPQSQSRMGQKCDLIVTANRISWKPELLIGEVSGGIFPDVRDASLGKIKSIGFRNFIHWCPSKASGNKTGRFPKDKRIVDEPGSNKGISGDLSTH
ncbi:15029_t:CDS:10, partial [Funneliformis mosseae]